MKKFVEVLQKEPATPNICNFVDGVYFFSFLFFSFQSAELKNLRIRMGNNNNLRMNVSESFFE